MVFVTFAYLVFFGIYKTGDDPRTGLAIAIGIDGMGHIIVILGIVEEAGDLADDEVMIGADKLDGAGIKGLRTLSGIAHDQHRLA